MISVTKAQNGKIPLESLRHEFFHKAFWEYLNDGDRIVAFSLAKEQWGGLGMEELEEKMAEDFSTSEEVSKPTLLRRI